MGVVVNWLVRLYPPSWRKRYGREMESLVDEMPGRVGVALDLLVGAAIAYRAVIRADRLLSAAGAYLHGLCVAVLVQAIAFVSLVLAGQGSSDPTELRLGPVDLATVVGPVRFELGPREQSPEVLLRDAAVPIAADVVVLAILIFVLVVVLTAPRLLRALR